MNYIKLSNGAVSFLVDVNNIAEIEEKKEKGFVPVMNGDVAVIVPAAELLRKGNTEYSNSAIAELINKSLSTNSKSDEQPKQNTTGLVKPPTA